MRKPSVKFERVDSDTYKVLLDGVFFACLAYISRGREGWKRHEGGSWWVLPPRWLDGDRGRMPLSTELLLHPAAGKARIKACVRTMLQSGGYGFWGTVRQIRHLPPPQDAWPHRLDEWPQS